MNAQAFLIVLFALAGGASAQQQELLAPSAPAQTQPALPPVRFATNFEGACLGKVEVVGPSSFRLAVPGQQDRHGRNRQASWFYFRMDGVRGRELTVTLS